ncbi:MAG: ATP-dependent DNA ligase [Myxococcota bacterium]
MLPFGPPLSPMLGQLANDLPEGDGWWFEPKWDGFRVLAFRDGDRLDLRSRDDRPLARYFPEVVAALAEALPPAAVVDGEIVIVRDGSLDFDALQLRLHPAASRVALLSEQTPAGVVLWDLLAEADRDLRDAPFRERRAALVAAVTESPSVRITPTTEDRAVARDWFERFEGAGLDGVMAKPPDAPYAPGKRAMVKVKHLRTLDCAVAGFRWKKGGKGEEVGSLVLGLFDDEGRLHPIGVASAFSKAEGRRLKDVLWPLRIEDPANSDHPWASWTGEGASVGMRSRWNARRDLSWVTLRLEKVVEVATTQHSGRRLRHPAKVVRWREDRVPASCRMEQLTVAPAPELAELFGRG